MVHLAVLGGASVMLLGAIHLARDMRARGGRLPGQFVVLALPVVVVLLAEAGLGGIVQGWTVLIPIVMLVGAAACPRCTLRLSGGYVELIDLLDAVDAIDAELRRMADAGGGSTEVVVELMSRLSRVRSPLAREYAELYLASVDRLLTGVKPAVTAMDSKRIAELRSAINAELKRRGIRRVL